MLRLRWLVAVLVVLSGGPSEAVVPGAAKLIAPSGIVTGTTHVFTFQAVPGASFYYFWLNDATASPRFTLWYPTGQACPSGSDTCTILLSEGLAVGRATWWIEAWNSDGYGPWSAAMTFTVAFLPIAWGYATSPANSADRFQLVFDGFAVLDRETGLVWDRRPDTGGFDYGQALGFCPSKPIAYRLGWRLPTLDELTSLVDTRGNTPPLSLGHPFLGDITTPYYWTTTPSAAGSVYGFRFISAQGATASLDKTSSFYRAWCVRGGGGGGAVSP
jgi:hypothetical protein